MADDKWIAGLRADLSVREAARLALGLRLGVVRDRQPDAALRADDDIEHVHQLRVGTRRAGAALRLFKDCLPPRLFKKTRQTLRTIRRSAGAARDWDVFLGMLQARLSRAPANQRRGLDLLLGFAHGQRVLAQEHLCEAHDAQAERFTRRIQQVNEALDSSEVADMTLGEQAFALLTPLLRDLESAASGDLANYDVLHQVRILGKKLRYAMEIFESCFAAEFRERFYPAVEEMQDILGLANDSHTACQRLEQLRKRLMRTQPKQWPRYQDGINALLAFHEKRLPMQQKKFERWWRAWVKSGAEQAFAELIRGT